MFKKMFMITLFMLPVTVCWSVTKDEEFDGTALPGDWFMMLGDEVTVGGGAATLVDTGNADAFVDNTMVETRIATAVANPATDSTIIFAAWFDNLTRDTEPPPTGALENFVDIWLNNADPTWPTGVSWIHGMAFWHSGRYFHLFVKQLSDPGEEMESISEFVNNATDATGLTAVSLSCEYTHSTGEISFFVGEGGDDPVTPLTVGVTEGDAFFADMSFGDFTNFNVGTNFWVPDLTPDFVGEATGSVKVQRAYFSDDGIPWTASSVDNWSQY